MASTVTGGDRQLLSVTRHCCYGCYQSTTSCSLAKTGSGRFCQPKQRSSLFSFQQKKREKNTKIDKILALIADSRLSIQHLYGPNVNRSRYELLWRMICHTDACLANTDTNVIQTQLNASADNLPWQVK